MKKIHPFYWSALIMVLSQIVSLLVASKVRGYLEQHQIVLPEVSLGVPLAYFIGAVGLLGLVLFIIPVSKLKIVFRFLFVLLFTWGLFVDLGFFLPEIPSALISFCLALVWLFRPRIWLHDILFILTLAAFGAIFGSLLEPWTIVIFMLILSVYDILAVRFGYMMWMAKKLSKLETLPAFIFPKDIRGWNMDIREIALLDEEASERNFSLLGGGDVGFPLILIAAILLAYGTGSSIVMCGFALAGLAAVYWIQRVFLKGKPIAALPPITISCLAGFLIVYFVW